MSWIANDNQNFLLKIKELQDLLIQNKDRPNLFQIYSEIFIFLSQQSNFQNQQTEQQKAFISNLVMFMVKISPENKSQEQYRLLDFLLNSKNISLIDQQLILDYSYHNKDFPINQQLKKDILNKTESHLEAEKLYKLYSQNLEEMLFYNEQKIYHEEMTDYIGKAVLTLDGEFLFCDKKTQKFLELKKSSKWTKINFFDLLIPFSLQLLQQVYCPEGNHIFIFEEDSQIGDSTTFPYVIYSKKNWDKIFIHLNKKSRRVVHYAKDTEPINKIYYLYLQALVSQFTLITMDLSSLKGKRLDSSNFNKNLLKNIYAKYQDNKQENYPCIFMKTKFSNFIPSFPYPEMENYPEIQKFKQFVQKKILKRRT